LPFLPLFLSPAGLSCSNLFLGFLLALFNHRLRAGSNWSLGLIWLVSLHDYTIIATPWVRPIGPGWGRFRRIGLTLPIRGDLGDSALGLLASSLHCCMRLAAYLAMTFL
jgi:hypothetical protein